MTRPRTFRPSDRAARGPSPEPQPASAGPGAVGRARGGRGRRSRAHAGAVLHRRRLHLGQQLGGAGTVLSEIIHLGSKEAVTRVLFLMSSWVWATPTTSESPRWSRPCRARASTRCQPGAATAPPGPRPPCRRGRQVRRTHARSASRPTGTGTKRVCCLRQARRFRSSWVCPWRCRRSTAA